MRATGKEKTGQGQTFSVRRVLGAVARVVLTVLVTALVIAAAAIYVPWITMKVTAARWESYLDAHPLLADAQVGVVGAAPFDAVDAATTADGTWSLTGGTPWATVAMEHAPTPQQADDLADYLLDFGGRDANVELVIGDADDPDSDLAELFTGDAGTLRGVLALVADPGLADTGAHVGVLRLAEDGANHTALQVSFTAATAETTSQTARAGAAALRAHLRRTSPADGLAWIAANQGELSVVITGDDVTGELDQDALAAWDAVLAAYPDVHGAVSGRHVSFRFPGPVDPTLEEHVRDLTGDVPVDVHFESAVTE